MAGVSRTVQGVDAWLLSRAVPCSPASARNACLRLMPGLYILVPLCSNTPLVAGGDWVGSS